MKRSASETGLIMMFKKQPFLLTRQSINIQAMDTEFNCQGSKQQPAAGDSRHFDHTCRRLFTEEIENGMP